MAFENRQVWRQRVSRGSVTCVVQALVIKSLPLFSIKKKTDVMLSNIERIFPTIGSNMKIDIDELVAIRKKRSTLFSDLYFTNKFWDIILLLYGYQNNENHVDSNTIAKHLEISHTSAMRYLHVLLADGVIGPCEKSAENGFNLAHDKISLTRQGFENTASVIQQMRKLFAAHSSPDHRSI